MKTTPPGTQFQNDFVASLSPLLSVTRLNDSKRNLKHERNPGDFIVFNVKVQYFVECKSTKLKLMSIGEGDGYKIKPHQIDLVLKAGEKPNCEGIFILNFREHKETYRVAAYNINYLYKHEKKKSITIEDCKEHGFKIMETVNADGYSVQQRYNLSFFNPQVF